MSYVIPTLQQLYEAHLSRLESQIGQDSPINDKAFLRVLAATEAGLDIGHYKYAADAALQNFALTATNAGLDRIGNDNSTPRKQAETAVLTATLPATTGTVVPVNREFVADANGLRYRTESEVTAVAGVATITIRCVETGTNGNLEIGDTLQISSQISGAETEATVTVIDTSGVDKESDTEYRPRVLFAQRAITGGGNATDHKIWAESVTGVKRAFPYAGKPSGVSYPGDRTVYVEATTSINADGIAPSGLLDSVRAAINTDPNTGLSRELLGLTNDTLYVQSIIRTEIFVEIRDLSVSAEKEFLCKNDIQTALSLYLRAIAPYVDGVDLAQERSDSITTLTMSEIIQDVLFSYGATAQGVGFGLVIGTFVPLYFLNPGELTKLGGIIYA
jgi:uncharacterized phage protein gp47/JayE